MCLKKQEVFFFFQSSFSFTSLENSFNIGHLNSLNSNHVPKSMSDIIHSKLIPVFITGAFLFYCLIFFFCMHFYFLLKPLMNMIFYYFRPWSQVQPIGTLIFQSKFGERESSVGSSLVQDLPCLCLKKINSDHVLLYFCLCLSKRDCLD